MVPTGAVGCTSYHLGTGCDSENSQPLTATYLADTYKEEEEVNVVCHGLETMGSPSCGVTDWCFHSCEYFWFCCPFRITERGTGPPAWEGKAQAEAGPHLIFLARAKPARSIQIWARM